MAKRKYILLIYLSVFYLSCLGQSKLDSLTKELAAHSKGEVKEEDILNQLVQSYLNSSPNYIKKYSHLRYNVQPLKIKNAIYNTEKLKETEQIPLKFEIARKKQENQLLQIDRNLQKNIIRKQEVSGLATSLVLILFILLAAMLYYLHERQRLNNFTLQKKNQEISSHRDQLIEKNFLIAEKNEEITALAEKINQGHQEILQKNQIIENKNANITASITYASRIQRALLPFPERIKHNFPEHFIFFKPRDIVSGDFYWCEEINGKNIIAAVDCTGHGVPGALMSMLGSEALNHIIIQKGITQVNEILTELNHHIRYLLKQQTSNNHDGMEMGICIIDPEKQTLEFAGAKNTLVYLQEGRLKHLLGDRIPIGGGGVYQPFAEHTFKKYQLDISIPTTFYLFSDGFQDQMGGPHGKKFMKKRFIQLLKEIHHKPMEIQKGILSHTLEDWMKEGHNHQVDDILVIGINVSPQRNGRLAQGAMSVNSAEYVSLNT